MSAPPHYEEKGGPPPSYPAQPYPAQPYPAQPYPPGPQQGYPQGGYPQGAPPQGYPQGAPPQGYPQGYAQGQPGYPAGGATVVAGTTVHSTNVVYTTAGGYGPSPAATKCQYCQADIVTSTHYEIGGLAWIIVASLFFAGFFILFTWFCCCIPCCVPSCKDVVHSCPNCQRQLGRYNRLN